MHESRSASSTVAYSILQFVIKYRSQQKMLIGNNKKGEPFFSILLFTLAVCFLLTASYLLLLLLLELAKMSTKLQAASFTLAKLLPSELLTSSTKIIPAVFDLVCV